LDGKFNPFVVADGRTGFYLAYVERINGSSNVMLRHSTNGKTFSEPIRVNNELGDATVRNENPPKLAVGPQGQLYVCWANERGRWKGNLRFARSTDGGKTFSPAITVNSDATGEPAGHAFQSLAVNSKGRVYLAWIDERNKKPGDRGAEIWMSTSEDGGRTFTADRRVLSDVCECCRTSLQIDTAGRILLSYRTVPPSGPMFRDIIVAVSNNGGQTFAKTVVSQDQWEINGCPVAGPGLTVNHQGEIAVVWFATVGERAGLYYAHSANHGVSFSPRRLLDADQKLGKHAQLVSQAEDKVVVAWDDLAGKSFLSWGVLDFGTGSLQKIGTYDTASYPVVAVAGDSALIAGLQSDRDVFFEVHPLHQDPKTAGKTVGGK